MTALIKKLTTEQAFDIVQIEFTQMAQYVRHVKQGKTFLHELDVSFRPAYRRYKNSTNILRKAVAFVEWCRWASFEPHYARTFNQVLTVTDNDRVLLKWLARSENITYFPHAVEVGSAIPPYSSRKPRTLVFVGTYSHQPNVDSALWLCSEIFPKILQKYPDAKLHLIGPHPTSEMKEYAASNPAINMPGFVDDVNTYLRESAVFITPLRYGGGVKNKVLFAMAQGIPVVSTPVGIEGIDGAEPAKNVLVADSVEKLVECVGLLFENPDLANSIGSHGVENVRAWYSWEYVIQKLEGIYRNVCGNGT